MVGHPRVISSSEQLVALQELARSERRDEADRARAVVLSANGWTSGQIARAFGVTPDSVRRWRRWAPPGGSTALPAQFHASFLAACCCERDLFGARPRPRRYHYCG